MYYYLVAGRGELIRLIAAAGGLDLAEGKPDEGVDRAAYGSPSGLPLLQHGAVKLSQSQLRRGCRSICALNMV